MRQQRQQQPDSIPQPFTQDQLLSLKQPIPVDFRDTGYDGKFCTGQISITARDTWNVQLTLSNNKPWSGTLKSNQFVPYPPGSMTVELPNYKFKDSIFNKINIGDKVKINKSQQSDGTWELAQVINICQPLIQLKLKSGKLWWSHYLLTDEIRPHSLPVSPSVPSTNSTQNQTYLRPVNQHQHQHQHQQQRKQINVGVELMNIIENCNNMEELNNVLTQGALQFAFKSPAAFVAYMFGSCMNSLPPDGCNQLYAALTTQSNNNINNNQSHCGHQCCSDHDHDNVIDTQQEVDDIEMDKPKPGQQNGNNRSGKNNRSNKNTRDKRNSNGNRNNRNSHNHNHQEEYQQLQSQDMISREEEAQREQTVSVQLLIDSTNNVLNVLNDYGDRMVELKEYEKNRKYKSFNINNKKKYQELKQFSQNCNLRAVAGIQLFQMQTQAFKEKSIKRGLSDQIGVKNSNKIINEFLGDMADKLIKQGKFNDEDISFIMDRIDPFTKAMKSVLDGNKLPEFQELTNVSFDQETANRTYSKIMGATNHTIPNKIENVRNDYKNIDMQHQMNVINMKDNKNKRNNEFNENDANNLYRDIYEPMQKQRTREEMERRANQDLQRDRQVAWTHQPDIDDL